MRYRQQRYAKAYWSGGEQGGAERFVCEERDAVDFDRRYEILHTVFSQRKTDEGEMIYAISSGFTEMHISFLPVFSDKQTEGKWFDSYLSPVS